MAARIPYEKNATLCSANKIFLRGQKCGRLSFGTSSAIYSWWSLIGLIMCKIFCYFIKSLRSRIRKSKVEVKVKRKNFLIQSFEREFRFFDQVRSAGRTAVDMQMRIGNVNIWMMAKSSGNRWITRLLFEPDVSLYISVLLKVLFRSFIWNRKVNSDCTFMTY